MWSEVANKVSLSLWRRGSDECNKKQPSDCDKLEYRNGEGEFPIINLLGILPTLFTRFK